MTTNKVVKEYDDYAKSVKDDHLSELPKKILDQNEKSVIINKFNVDFDLKCDSKALEFVKMFPSQGDKAVLNSQFMASRIKYNDEFKDAVMNWNSANENNPIE